MDIKKNQEIVKTYINSESGLKENQRQFLAYKNDGLVPCTLEQQRDSFSLIFDDSNLKPYLSVTQLNDADKLRALVGAASLETLVNDYTFSLAPDNLLIDVNFRPKVIERMASNGTEDFLSMYKALIGCTLKSNYSYNHFLRGSAFLFNGNHILRTINKMNTAQEIKSFLTDECDAIQEEESKKYIKMNKKRVKTYRMVLPITILLTVLCGIITIYFAAYKNPINKAIIAGNNAYLEQDYLSVQEELSNIKIEDLPFHSKYILSRSFVITEGLSNTQRDNVLAGITLQTDYRYLCFWIAIGRLDYEASEDYAERLGDDELLLYSLCKHKKYIQDDPYIKGAEKTKQITELSEKIKQLEEKLVNQRTDFENRQNELIGETVSETDLDNIEITYESTEE